MSSDHVTSPTHTDPGSDAQPSVTDLLDGCSGVSFSKVHTIVTTGCAVSLICLMTDSGRPNHRAPLTNPLPFGCLYCFDKHNLSPPYNTDPFNCTRTSLHRHTTKYTSYQLENVFKRAHFPRRCPHFLVFFGTDYSGCKSSPSIVIFLIIVYRFDLHH